MIPVVTSVLLDAATQGLKENAGLTAAFASETVRVLQIVPEYGSRTPMKYPFVTFGGIDKRGLPGGCGDQALVDLFTHVWDEDKTIRRACNITEACEEPLMRLVLPVESGLKIMAREFGGSRCSFDQERNALFGLVKTTYKIAAA